MLGREEQQRLGGRGHNVESLSGVEVRKTLGMNNFAYGRGEGQMSSDH